jgi:ABC-type multidrug transport system permease subunit
LPAATDVGAFSCHCHDSNVLLTSKRCQLLLLAGSFLFMLACVPSCPIASRPKVHSHTAIIVCLSLCLSVCVLTARSWCACGTHTSHNTFLMRITCTRHSLLSVLVVTLVLLRVACRPFPIIMGASMLPDTPLGFYAIEFSPLYIGSAAFFNDTTPPIGGGFVDPIGAAAMTCCTIGH